MIIGTGIDIVQNERLKPEHSRRVLSERETVMMETFTNPSRKLEFLCGRFALKEAIIKAIGHTEYRLGMRDITILNDETGMPYVAEPQLENILFHISLSHEKDYSVGLCILENV